MAADGDSNDEIAGRLHISTSSVEGRLKRASVAVGARNRAHLVSLAYRTGQLALTAPDEVASGGAA